MTSGGVRYSFGVRFVDTHAHLCDPAFEDDLVEVVGRAREAGVVAVVAVGETVADAERNLALACEHPGFVRPAAGLFPTVLDPVAADAVIALARQHRHQLVAIGEVGLDRWKVQDEEERETQRRIFGSFVELAIELDLPLNVHSRSAGRQTIDFLLARGARRVQMHAFDGRAAKALPGVEAGFFFSVPPSIERSAQKRKLVGRLPLDCLLAETDSPVLGPSPPDRNEPANVARSVGAIAEIKGLAVEAVAEALLENTRRLYGPSIVG